MLFLDSVTEIARPSLVEASHRLLSGNLQYRVAGAGPGLLQEVEGPRQVVRLLKTVCAKNGHVGNLRGSVTVGLR